MIFMVALKIVNPIMCVRDDYLLPSNVTHIDWNPFILYYRALVVAWLSIAFILWL